MTKSCGSRLKTIARQSVFGSAWAGMLLLLIVSECFAAASDTRQRKLHYGICGSHYNWSEYGNDGSRLLDENGYLYGLGYDFDSAKGWLGWRNGGELFFGEVNYDGQTWSLTPIRTDVLYIGTTLYLDAVPQYRLQSGLLVKGFSGIGTRLWYRNLDDTKTAAGVRVSGSEEWWWSLYGGLGAGVVYPVGSHVELFAEAGVKLPVYTRVETRGFASGHYSADLEPDQEYSGFGEIGLEWKRLTVKLVYDSLRFDRSDAKSSGQYEIYQPESDADILSLNILWSHRF